MADGTAASHFNAGRGRLGVLLRGLSANRRSIATGRAVPAAIPCGDGPRGARASLRGSASLPSPPPNTHAPPRQQRFAIRLIHTAPIPGEGDELGLYQRGADYFIKIVGGQDLMNTRAHASEDALGIIACKGLQGRPQARVLIGGLGMGFTLSASLKTLGADAEVVVAEIVPAVVEWNRGVLADFAGRPLDDPRARVQTVDVTELLQKERAGFDAIVLDVDNGPDGLTRASNQWLYSKAGLSVVFSALRPGGALAIWSAGPDRAFTGRLRAVGFAVEEVTVRAHAGKGARHVIWMARRS